MKRHEFVTRTSEFCNLNYILRFGLTTIRKIRLPAPVLFDYTRRNRWAFNVIQFDEFVIQKKFYNPKEGVVLNEEEHMDFRIPRGSPLPSGVKGHLLLGA